MRIKYDEEIMNLEHLIARIIRASHGHKMVTGEALEKYIKYHEENITVFWEEMEMIGMDALKAMQNVELIKNKVRESKRKEKDQEGDQNEVS